MSDSEHEAADPDDAVVERHDPPGLISQPAQGWEYKPYAVITLVKDAASSATIAARHVFCCGGSYPMSTEERQCARRDPDDPDLPELCEISCHMHASLRWCHVNHAKFNGFTDADGKQYTRLQARNSFQNNLDRVMKNLQFIHFKPTAIRLLKKKWRGLNNSDAVNSWCKSWAKKT